MESRKLSLVSRAWKQGTNVKRDRCEYRRVELHEPDSNFVRRVLVRKHEKREDGSWESVVHGVPRSLDGVKLQGSTATLNQIFLAIL